jgi:HlyD family secretion protein
VAKSVKIILLVLVFAAVLALQHYRSKAQLLEVNVAAVTLGQLDDSILASGNLVYNTQIQIRSELTGRVAAVLVEEGQQVEKDQLLLKLDPTAYQAEVTKAEAMVARSRIEISSHQARLENLQRQLNRQQQLLQRKLVQVETVDLLQSEVRLAQIEIKASQQQLAQSIASLAMAQDALNKTEFRAPIAGLLVSVDVKVGETVIPGTTNIIGSDLMTLADQSAILAELRVDEADINAISLGQSATVFAASNPNQAIAGKVIAIGSSARLLGQSQALSFRVKVLLEQAILQLKPGISCRAELLTQRLANTLSVPVAAIQKSTLSAGQTDSKPYFVWTVQDGKAVKVRVEPGLATDTAQAVLSGLSEGQQVITGPARTMASLSEGSKVKVTELTL